MRNFITCYDCNGLVCVSVSDILCIESITSEEYAVNSDDHTLISLRGGRKLFVFDSVDSIVRKLHDIEA